MLFIQLQMEVKHLEEERNREEFEAHEVNETSAEQLEELVQLESLLYVKYHLISF